MRYFVLFSSNVQFMNTEAGLYKAYNCWKKPPHVAYFSTNTLQNVLLSDEFSEKDRLGRGEGVSCPILKEA
jgi:hypothetical protein